MEDTGNTGVEKHEKKEEEGHTIVGVEMERKSPVLPNLTKLPIEIERYSKTKFLLKDVKFENEESRSELIDELRGPSDTSNWVIKNILLMSAYPFLNPEIHSAHLDNELPNGHNEETYSRKLMKDIVDSGVRVFLSLQTSKELEERRFDNSIRFHDYKKIAEEISGEECLFRKFEIADYGVPESVEVARECVKLIFKDIEAGRKVLVHCYGGHGRSGLIIGCFLAECYRKKLEVDDILRYIQVSHDCRKVVTLDSDSNWTYFSPETESQRDFIRTYYKSVC